jgi:hypothetical protein
MKEELNKIFEVSQPKLITTKICIRCKERKPISSFRKDRNYYHPRCVDCSRKFDKVIREIHKTAPPVTELCQCCGKSPKDRPKGKLILDHDYKTNKFRGWICDLCNIGIGKLGDDLEGVLNAVRYLERIRDGVPHTTDSSNELI